MKKRVGVLGSGVVGQVLAAGFLKHGHQVMVGTREAGKLADWTSKAGVGAKVGSFPEAAAFGEVVVLAVKGTAASEALTQARTENLRGKTVIDVTNPIADAPPVNGVLRFFTSLEESLMERLQRQFPEANLVKALSSVGNGLMVDPDFGGVKPTMFVCGNRNAAKQEVTTLLEEFGWEAEDMGGVEAARAIEPLCMLWCIPGLMRNQWTHAFKLLRK